MDHFSIILNRLVDLQQEHDALLLALVSKGLIVTADIDSARELVKPVHDATRRALMDSGQLDVEGLAAALDRIDQAGEACEATLGAGVDSDSQ